MPQPDQIPRVNFLDTDQDKAIRRQTILLAVVFSVLVAGVAALGAGASYRAASHGTSAGAEIFRLPIIGDIQRALFGSTQPAAAQQTASGDRMNILILGIGGEGHDGPELTDTMILASVDLKDNRVGLVSIPRDLAYPLGDGKFEKINAVNAYEEMDHPGEGAKRTADDVSKLLEVPIDHVFRIDFRGFEQLIDAIGGIQVTVERSFTDNSYPTDDGRWTTVSFKQGMQYMDGSQALVYTRSRHGNNGEGSDFARSKRQQIVMLAIRAKLLSLGTLADPRKLAGIYSAINNNIQSDLNVWDMLKLAPFAQAFDAQRVTMNVLTDAPDGTLVAANVEGSYMLFPKKPDWSEIRAIAQNPFATPTDRAAEEKPVEHVALEVRNGTQRTGFASQAAAKLEKGGYVINHFGNAVRRGYERSIVYDLTGGKKTTELARLKKLLNAEVSSVDAKTIKPIAGSNIRTFMIDPDTSERIYAPDTDFVLILGDNATAFLDTAVIEGTPVSSTER